MTMPKFEPVALKDIEAKNRIIFPPMKPEKGDDGWVALFTEAQLTAAYEAGKRDAVPEGWKLVPIEPTNVMLVSGISAMASSLSAKCISCWDAMLAAAPSPEGEVK